MDRARPLALAVVLAAFAACGSDGNQGALADAATPMESGAEEPDAGWDSGGIVGDGGREPDARDAPSNEGAPVDAARLDGSAATTDCPVGSLLVPLDRAVDWRAQDFPGSAGITRVTHEAPDGIDLVLELDPDNADRGKGEALIDLGYTSRVRRPVDITGATVSATLQIPAGLVNANPACPNGVQLFVKDSVVVTSPGGSVTASSHAQYGRWQNVVAAGPFTVTLRPSLQPSPDEIGYTDAGFTPTSIRTIGIKVALSDARDGMGHPCAASYSGVLRVAAFDVNPPVPLTPPADLPSRSPRPDVLGASLEIRSDGMYRDGARLVLVGGNFRAIEFGQNFFHTAWFPRGNGIPQHSSFVRCELEEFGRAGVQVVRVGILDDGRALLGPGGEVFDAGVEPFLDDVEILLSAAESKHVAVELVLVDYLVAGKGVTEGGVVLRGRRSLLTDETVRAAFVAKFATRLVQRFGAHPGLFGIDVISEPEWIVSRSEGGKWEDFVDTDGSKAEMAVPRASLEAFVSSVAQVTRQYAPKKFVTVGTSIVTTGLVQALPLDYLAPHYYAWMGSLPNLVASIPPGRVWLLEEFSTKAGPPDVVAGLNAAATAGGSGAWIWNLTPGIDGETYPLAVRNGVLESLATWRP